MTTICLIFIVACETNTSLANIPGDSAESKTGNIVYANDFEALMARVVILILTDFFSYLSFLPLCNSNIFVKK